jgi:integrase
MDKIDIANKNIIVSCAIAAGERRLKDTKTESGNRTVPIPEELLPYLINEKANKPFGFLFLTKTGKQLNGLRLCDWWNSIKKAMVLYVNEKNKDKIITSTDMIGKDLTAYCLRHTFCTDLERAGVPLNTAKYLMGHSDISVTSKIYTHKTTEVIEDARKAINIFNNKQNGQNVPNTVPNENA